MRGRLTCAQKGYCSCCVGNTRAAAASENTILKKPDNNDWGKMAEYLAVSISLLCVYSRQLSIVDSADG